MKELNEEKVELRKSFAKYTGDKLCEKILNLLDFYLRIRHLIFHNYFENIIDNNNKDVCKKMKNLN